MRVLLFIACLLGCAGSADAQMLQSIVNPKPAVVSSGFTVIAHNGYNIGQDTGTTASLTTTGADTIIFGVSWYGGFGTTPPAITDNKGNGTATCPVTSVVNDGFVAICYYKNAAVGSGHTFTVTGSSIYSSVAVLAVSGGDLTAPFDQSNHFAKDFGSPQTVQPGSVTPGSNNEIVVSVLSGRGSANISTGVTINSGFSTLADLMVAGSGLAYQVNFQYLIQTTAGAVNPTWAWTWTSDGGVNTAIATFKAR